MPKRLGTLAAILAVLCAVIAFIFWKNSRTTQSQPLAGLKAARVSKISVQTPGQDFTLVHSKGKWTLASPMQDRADSSACAELVKDLSSMTIGDQVAQNPSSYAEYAITDASATRVSLYETGKARPAFDAYFGKTAMGFDSLYLRRPGRAPVYLAEGLSRYAVTKTADDYRARTIFTISRDQARTIIFRTKKRTYTLVRSSATWSLAGRPKVKPARVAAIVTDLYSLRIPAFPKQPAPSPAMGFKRPTLSIAVSSSGQPERVVVGRKKISPHHQTPYYYYALIKGRPAPVFLAAYDVRPLLKALKF